MGKSSDSEARAGERRRGEKSRGTTKPYSCDGEAACTRLRLITDWTHLSTLYPPGSVSTSILPAIRGPIRGTSHAMRRARSSAPSSGKGSRSDSFRCSSRMTPPGHTGWKRAAANFINGWNKKEIDVSRDSLWNKQSNVNAQNINNWNLWVLFLNLRVACAF